MIAALAAAYAVLAAEANRRDDARRARVERVLEAVLGLAEGAVRAEEMQGEGAQYRIARLRLDAELKIAGIRGLEHTDLMVRPTATPADVVAQSEQAILEVGARLDELAPRPLWRRRPTTDFRRRR